MFCSECGKEINNNSKFCSFCGARQINNLDVKKKAKDAEDLPTKSRLSNKNLKESKTVKPQYKKEEIEYWRRRKRKDSNINMSAAGGIGTTIVMGIYFLKKFIESFN